MRSHKTDQGMLIIAPLSEEMSTETIAQSAQSSTFAMILQTIILLYFGQSLLLANLLITWAGRPLQMEIFYTYVYESQILLLIPLYPTIQLVVMKHFEKSNQLVLLLMSAVAPILGWAVSLLVEYGSDSASGAGLLLANINLVNQQVILASLKLGHSWKISCHAVAAVTTATGFFIHHMKSNPAGYLLYFVEALASFGTILTD